MSMTEVINTQVDGSLGAENLSSNAIRKKSFKKTKTGRRKVKKKTKTKSKFGFGSQSSRFTSGGIYKSEKNSTPGPKVGHKKWTDSKIAGGNVQPKGIKTRFSDHGSHLKEVSSCVDDAGLDQEDRIENVDKGVKIMPRGCKSRFS